ncbi:hypothetical protein HA050_11920 [Iodobacter sp. HSC-16F04]|uniref:Uncharacterized protein n=1 Tax=Iodobacter violaceini TaxID=3044271 RepID=A0ABX0KSK1_9NEIS|nr:hypothetical protein [Iodobacter violacea]NHQ86826.1 hypothetical protein [Iodobacter violacea]
MENIKTSSLSPEGLFRKWRNAHWPPKGMRSYPDLPLYIGTHEQVAEFSQTMGEVLLGLSSHIEDTCRGKIPRWLDVPKVSFDVLRVNLTQTIAKASKQFADTDQLVRRCGRFDANTLQLINAKLLENPFLYIVAHRPFHDVRAYVFSSNSEPDRLHFLQCGLVLACTQPDDLLIQDQRNIYRKRRKDAYGDSLGTSDTGWSIYLK